MFLAAVRVGWIGVDLTRGGIAAGASLRRRRAAVAASRVVQVVAVTPAVVAAIVRGTSAGLAAGIDPAGYDVVGFLIGHLLDCRRGDCRGDNEDAGRHSRRGQRN